MALRSSWDGFLRLSMISVPVRAFSASGGSRAQIGFHQIHAKCGHRIRYQKTCPIHGEVSKEEVAPGYEHAKGEYVVLDPKELKRLKEDDTERSVSIDVFVQPDALDPAYYGDRTYYLTPDGRAGEKPYAVLHRAMVEAGRYGIGTLLLSGREHAALVRPVGDLLAVTLLRFYDEVRSPEAYEAEVPDTAVSGEELRLARTLLDASSTDDFDFSRYKDDYAGKVLKLIESKGKPRKGRGRVPAGEPPVILNLMDALRQSLAKSKGRSGTASSARTGNRRPRTRAKAASKHRTG
jgi:DNA end-binding protein Ku